MMNKIWSGMVSGLLMAALTLSGCVGGFSLGGRHVDAPNAVNPTIGQELIDLKKARDAGAISEEEYQKKKEQILAK